MSSLADSSNPEFHQQPKAGDRLDSWKEIAGYFKRSVRTVRRWEAQEGLPVHRHIHQISGTVYAYKFELDTWWASRAVELEPTADPAEVATAPPLTSRGIELEPLGNPADIAVISPVAPLRSRFRGPRLITFVFCAAGLMLVALGAYFTLRQVRPPALAANPNIRLLVLPFDNLTGDAEQEYLSAGLTTEMIQGLGALKPAELLVIARTTALTYKQTAKSIADIRRELRVDYILEGTVRRSGDRIRVTAQLVDARSSTRVWSNTYDRGTRDVFQLQTEIARTIAGQVLVAFGRETHGGTAQHVNSEAHDAWLRGQFYLAQATADGFAQAIANFEKAIALDPGFAAPYAALADVYINEAIREIQPVSNMLDKAEMYAVKAIDLDPSQAHAHMFLGRVKFYRWDLNGADNEFRTAIALNPSLSDAYLDLAQTDVLRQRKHEADSQFDRAIDLDPASSMVYARIGFVQDAMGNPTRAEQMCNHALELEPTLVFGRYCLGHTYTLQGQPARAISMLRKAANSELPGVVASLARAYAINGDRQAALQTLKQLQADGPHVPSPLVAMVWNSLGERETALDWLEKAYQEHSPLLIWAAGEGMFDEGLRSDPRFLQLMNKVTRGS